ncbi:MAG: hypothetical protein ACI4Q8_07430 [Ruminococcus sp.]
MPTLYLHIGMPKTGTSYIQKFLRVNGNVLKTKGYVFPIFPEVPNVLPQRNARFLLHTYRDKNGKADKIKKREVWNSNFEYISQLFTEYDNMILSDESIWGLNKKNKRFWKRLKKELNNRGIDCKIIAYLRRQDLFQQSHWAQIVQAYETCTFTEYINGVSKDRLDYYTRLNDIAKFMGKENIIVRVYEKQQWGGTQNNLISDFFNAVGLELTDDFVTPEKSVVNISISGKYLAFKRYMNRYPERQAKSLKKDCLYRALGKLTYKNASNTNYGKNVFLTQEETLNYLDRFKEQNELVAKEYLGREDGVLFMDEILVDEQKAEYTLEDFLEVANEVFTYQDEELEKEKALVRELKQTIKEKDALIKNQQKTIEWVTTSFPKKVVRKLKSIFKIK